MLSPFPLSIYAPGSVIILSSMNFRHLGRYQICIYLLCFEIHKLFLIIIKKRTHLHIKSGVQRLYSISRQKYYIKKGLIWY
jgi:hypothetical protein